MNALTQPFLDDLDRRVDGVVDACTACGKCVEVCPTPAITGADARSTEEVAGGVIDILKGDVGNPEAETWARACCGTAACLDICPEGINPRFMLAMARRELNERQPKEESKQTGRKLFQNMSRGVKLLSRLQLPPDVLNRLNPPANREKPDQAPDVVFYTGCNLLKTPHIGLLCMDVFDRIGVSYEVYGGPANCCGILQFRPGDTENSARQAMTTVQRFQETGADDVVAWCPTCQIQFSEVILPSVPDTGEDLFDIKMLPIFLAERMEALRPHMMTAVTKKVALFEFPGAVGVTQAVEKLLGAVPGLELVDLERDHAGYQMSALDTMPEHRQETIAGAFRAAEDLGVDILLSVFHADHREISSHSGEWPFEVKNYMDILGESMGLYQEDLYQRLKAMQDIDAIVADMAATVEANGIDLDEMREAVAAYMIGDQYLPIDRSQHPDAAE